MDLTFRYGGKSKVLGDRRYEVGLTVRNATDEGDIVTLYNGNLGPSRKARVDGRQFVLSFKVDI